MNIDHTWRREGARIVDEHYTCRDHGVDLICPAEQERKHGIFADVGNDPGSKRLPIVYVPPVRCICGWQAPGQFETYPQVVDTRYTYGEYTSQLLAAVLHLDGYLGRPREVADADTA